MYLYVISTRGSSQAIEGLAASRSTPTAPWQVLDFRTASNHVCQILVCGSNSLSIGLGTCALQVMGIAASVWISPDP